MKTKSGMIQTAVLLVAGTLMILVGAVIIASPVNFYAANDIDLGGNVSLLNELKAPAGFLLAAGLFVIGAIFIKSLADTAMLLATMLYLSYAGARILSMLFDGVPAAGLVQATLLESVVGLACLAVLMVRRKPQWRAS